MISSVQTNPYLYLVGGWATPLKYMSASVGMIIPNLIEKSKIFQTTNQNIWKWSSDFLYKSTHPRNSVEVSQWTPLKYAQNMLHRGFKAYWVCLNIVGKAVSHL